MIFPHCEFETLFGLFETAESWFVKVVFFSWKHRFSNFQSVLLLNRAVLLDFCVRLMKFESTCIFFFFWESIYFYVKSIKWTNSCQILIFFVNLMTKTNQMFSKDWPLDSSRICSSTAHFVTNAICSSFFCSPYLVIILS